MKNLRLFVSVIGLLLLVFALNEMVGKPIFLGYPNAAIDNTRAIGATLIPGIVLDALGLFWLLIDWSKDEIRAGEKILAICLIIGLAPSMLFCIFYLIGNLSTAP